MRSGDKGKMLSIACSTAAPASFKCGAPSRSVRTFAMGRREAVAGGLVIPVIFNLLNPKLVSASKAGPAADRLWESLGGAKDDIAFPELFKGRWVVESTLISAATPQGEDLVPDMRVVQRARDQDLHATQQYSITFSTNGR